MAETDRLGAYANWLVANKAKQGTPEFETVANAYRSLRSPAPAPDTSLSGALVQGYDQAGAMVGKGIQSLGEYASIPSVENYGRQMADRNEAEIAASGYQRPEGADGIIKNLREGEFANAGNSLLYGATEALPQVGGGVVASVGAGLAATTAPILGTAAAVGGTLYGAVNALGQVRDEKETKGLDPTANAADLATAAASGLVELLPIKGGGATLRVMREAGQEAVQEGLIIGDTMVQGGEYVPQEVVDRLGDSAVIGGTIAKGANMATSAASKVADAVTPAPRADTPENRADASFAQRIQRIATTGDLNGVPFSLKDVNSGSQHGVRAAMDAAHTDLVGQISSDAKVLRENLSPKDTDSYDLALEKVQAQVGLKMARNKTKSVVTKDNFEALEKLVGTTTEGQNLLNLVRESQVLTRLHNNEYKGGVSRFTDFALPFDNAQNGYNVGAQVARNITSPSASLGLAMYTGGGSIPYQAGVVAAGRGIDAITGRRSRLNRFVKKNQGAAGLDTPAGLPSIRQGRIDTAQLAADQKVASEAASAASLAQRTERLKQTNLGLARKNAPPVPTSPQGTVEAATGLNRSGVARILRVVEATNQDQLIGEAIQAYRGTVAFGGRVPDISPLIRTINQMVESQPAFKQLRVREPDTGVAQAAATGSPIQTSSENYQRGIDDNKAMLQDLKDKASTDATMSPADKAKVLGALDEMGMDLGSDPAGKVNAILSGLNGVDPDAVAQYIEPYAARVMGQQSAAPRSSQQVQDAGVLSGASPPISSPPKVAEVKQQATLATASLEIGKAGSDLENGIKDMAGIQRLADAYNISIKFYNSNVDMQGAVPSVNKNAMGVYQQRERVAHVVRTGDLNELVTTLHEVLHGVGVSSAKTGNYLGELNTQNGLTGLPDVYGANSLEGLMDFTLGKAKNDPIRRAVLSELKHIQDRGLFTSGGATAPIRGAQSSASALAGIKKHYRDIGNKDFEAERVEIQKKLKDHQNYERSIGELTVDALLMYFNDPKTMKRVAPETAKMMRTFLKNAGNKKIQLYSHPLAMVVAAVMAILAKSQAPEEEEQQQMPAGALSPQLGMLSA